MSNSFCANGDQAPGGRSRMAHAVAAKPTSRCACLRGGPIFKWRLLMRGAFVTRMPLRGSARAAEWASRVFAVSGCPLGKTCPQGALRAFVVLLHFKRPV